MLFYYSYMSVHSFSTDYILILGQAIHRSSSDVVAGLYLVAMKQDESVIIYIY